MRKLLASFAVLGMAAALSGCATSDPSGQNDPYEQTNRQIFDMNTKLDQIGRASCRERV